VVQSACAALLEFSSNIGKHFFRFPDQGVIRGGEYCLRIAAGPGTPDECPASESAGTGENRSGVFTLRVHRADHHEVGPQQIFVTQLLECLIDKAYAPRGGTKRSDCDETEGRCHRAFGEHLECAFEAPK
jgi:hypothetical protein